MDETLAIMNTVKGVEGLNRAPVPHCGPLRGLRAISRLTIGLARLLIAYFAKALASP